MGAIITLTTDFGLADSYVAAMKGVILGINPEAKLVDISHMIKPQNIPEAAFVLSMAYPFFPDGTIHVVVVDPGVGTRRKAIILRTPKAVFVAPDNGALSYVIEDCSTKHGGDGIDQHLTKLEPRLEAVAITRSEFWRTPVSSTFHGRDIFAPVAAHLSLGLPLIEFGEKISSLTTLPILRPHREQDGALMGQILHIDGFGNLITNIKGDDLPGTKKTIAVEVGSQRISGLSRTYSEGRGLLALIGSSGYLEISLREGSAGAFLNTKVGDKVKVV